MRYFKVLLTILVVTLPIVTIFAILKLLKVNHIECLDQYGVCSDSIFSKLKSFEGKNLLAGEKEARNSLLRNPSVSQFSIQYNFPDILKIRILARKPNFALKDSLEGTVAEVDENGFVVDIEKTSSLPMLEVQERPPGIGGKVNEKALFASKILYGMFYLYNIKAGVVGDDSLTVRLSNGPLVIFPLSGDKDVELGAANLIISRLNKNGQELRIENVKEIDLRFKNPILR